MNAAPSLSLRTASSRIPSLSASSSSLSSTFSDISFSSSSSIPSPPSTSASKTHAFFAFRSHSPEPILKQNTAPSADVSATPTPLSILKSQSSGPSGPHSDLDDGSLAIYRKTDCNLGQPRLYFSSPPSDEPTPRPTNVTPASLFASAVVEPIPSASLRASAKEQTSVDLLLHNVPPSLSSIASTTPDSSSQTFITGQNTDTTLRLLHALGQGSFSSVWLAEDLSSLPLSLKAKRGLRELRRRAGQGGNSSLPSDDEQRNSQHASEALADVSRNASLKRLRARVRGTKPSRGNIRLMDGSYLVDERDGEMGVIRIELCDSTDAEDNHVNDHGLRTNLARVGSLSGKVTNVSPNDKGLYRRNSTKPKSARLVAVKLTPRGGSSQREADKERVAFVREVEVLRHISHPNITPLLSHLSTPTHYILVFPYLPGGDLLTLVNSDTMWYLLGEDVLRRIWCELCKAVGWMHGVGLVHRDIKLENIVLTTSVFSSLGLGSSRPTLNSLPPSPTPFIRLSDFGLSRFVDLYPNGEAELLMTRCGSEAYAAPELVTGGGKSLTSTSTADRTKSSGVYDARETDAWACGVVLYALVARRLPFGEGVANDDVVGMASGNVAGETVSGCKIYDKTRRRRWLMRIAKGEYSWPAVENEELSSNQEDLAGPRLVSSRGARRIVGKLLVRDPGKRARIADLWNDPWMNGTGVEKDLARGTTSASTVHDFVDEIGNLELQQSTLSNSNVENLDEEKCWLEDEEIEKLEKEEEQDGAWLVDEHRIHSITRQELA